MNRIVIFLKATWTIVVWCVCMGLPYFALYRYGPGWCIAGGVVAYVAWLALGELWVCFYVDGERLYTLWPQALVVHNSLLAIAIGIYHLIVRTH